ncbi:MAG: NADH-quinone oxidoreductase subunit N [Ilumatobacteraceae bacterium]|nr:NADH-quinone oxidoreductase subunit N [Actinomycetota bacterium]MDP4635058.1 NADH-quinone oxidoreductase subunit N [Ilumatobacteraceae bacterium]MDP4735894.1 NADH-quinone oxidoreductase subunit N [Ilumatobacteraceae bacterium]MDP4980548.1 NADH-quinone oxidoreductase subunit N [Ilumatobacteraceae bacterium]
MQTLNIFAAQWVAPTIDYFGLAPELVLAGGLCLVLMLDLFIDERKKWMLTAISSFTLLAAMVPVLMLALSETEVRTMFDGRYVVDNFSLVMKAVFLLAGYVVVLLSSSHIEQGEYWRGEYWFLLLTSLLGMLMMASSRDLVSIFVALEFLSIPAYMLAAWRKRDPKSNEAGVKYFLLGVFASAVMLYGMSLMYGVANSTLLTEIGAKFTATGEFSAVHALAVVFVVVGFAFKVSAVPFHTWAPDTYEGAPTPVTAFLSVASKAAGFVALVVLLYTAFPLAQDIWQPFIWVLSALTMTIGNVLALKQNNIVRMIAYSSISQGGFVLMPLAVAGLAGSGTTALRSVVLYMIVYAATNLGVFAIILAVSNKTRSGEISSYGGLFSYAPTLGVLMTLFLASLAGIPPLGGWIAKFVAFQSLIQSQSTWGYALAVVGAVNSVVAFGYYGNVMREIWMRPVPDNDTTLISVPGSLKLALVITAGATLVFGILPGVGLHFADLAEIAGAIIR